jgi:hypothetical protein
MYRINHTIRSSAVIGIAATAFSILAPAALATQPTVVYESLFTQFTPIEPHDIAIDDAGCAYILASRPGNDYATRVLKLDPDGHLIWSQMFDGDSHDIPGGLAIDTVGDVYVVGTTGSDDFPTLHPLQAAPSSVQYEAFVMKLSGVDGTLLYSTYFGSTYSEWGNDIAVNDAGEMYIIGQTHSPYLPTVNPLQDHLGGDPYFPHEDAFIAKFSADGSELLYSTYFGGGGVEDGRGIVLDSAGRMYITGTTTSDDFPTVNPVQGSMPEGGAAFAARISADGSTIDYSTYLGGEEREMVYGIALDHDNRLYIAGHTESVDFPTTPGAFQEDFVGEILGCEVPFGASYNCDDVFVACLTPDGSALHYATYLGGHQIDQCYGLAVNQCGSAYVAGHTKSDDFPPYASGTFFQIYLSKLNEAGSDLVYTRLHDTVTVSPARVAVDSAGDVYLVGTINTPPDLFVVKLHDGSQGACECPGDMNADGQRNVTDFTRFAAAYGSRIGDADYDPNADLSGDGFVNATDFSRFASYYGTPCP